MADIKISELSETTDLNGLYTIGTDKNNLSKKVALQFLKDAANYANMQGDYAKEVGDSYGGKLTELESEVKKVGFVLGTFPSKIIMYDANSDSIFDYGAKSELYISESSWTSTPDSKSIFVPNQNKSKLVIRVRSVGCQVAFLKSNRVDIVDYCDNQSVITFSAFTTNELDIPTDCQYVFIHLFRGGTKLMDSFVMYTSEEYNTIQESKYAKLTNNTITGFNAFNISGNPYSGPTYPDNTRLQIFVPCTGMVKMKLTAKAGYVVALSVYNHVAEGIYDNSLLGKYVYLNGLDGINSGVPLNPGESREFIFPSTIKTLVLWLRKENNGNLDAADISSAVSVETSYEDDYISMSNGNTPFYIIDYPSSVLHVDTKEKKIIIPNSACVLYGKAQGQAWAFVGGAEVSYDIDNIGNLVKMVFNPNVEQKFYLLPRERVLNSDEYFLFFVLLEPIVMGLPPYMYVVDGETKSNFFENPLSGIVAYTGTKVDFPIEKKHSLSVVRKGRSLNNDMIYNGVPYYVQGMAFYGNYLFRLSYSANNDCLCHVYDVTEIDAPVLVNRFPLGFSGEGAHANACQFGNDVNDSGFPYLYIRNGVNHACVVEKISLTSSQVVQTININYSGIFTSGGGEGNTIIGDDDFIWYFGANDTHVYFAKFNKPSISNKAVTLTKSDMVDAWEIPLNDAHIGTTWQGGKVKNGYIYFLFGSSQKSNRMYVVDTTTHELKNIIPLNCIIEECEDVDFHNNSMYVGITSWINGFYEINHL